MKISELKHSIKGRVGQAMLRLGLHRIQFADKGVVVAFHRVNSLFDSSGLTVTPKLFESYCQLFSRYFNVVSLSHFVERLEHGESVGGMLAITFDDGYRDNYDVAAPILKRWKLPATFFVTTQFIGTDIIPEWDRVAGVTHPWMTWEQVVALHAQGFEIGAHTRRHVDLGAASIDSAREELSGSRFDLRQRLGVEVDLFAYPFGGANHISEANRGLVKDSGFRCCCSCFGGVNTGLTDPFVLRRVAISPWLSSPWEFAFEFVISRI